MRFTYKGKFVRKSTEVTDQKLAKRIYDKVRGEIAQDRWFESLPGEDKTFREMMEKFQYEYFSNLASFKSCKSYINGLVAFFGDYTVLEITPRLISEFKIRRKAEGVKTATIHRQIGIMKTAYNLAMREWEWCNVNPVAKVSLGKLDNKRDKWLTPQEEERLLEASPVWLQEIVIFAINTGMRISEILSLTWKEVDLFRKTIIVLKSKNNRKRTIPINETIFGLIKTKAKGRSIKTDLIFHTKSHNPINRNNVGRAFRSTVKKVGINDFRLHDLRHTFATRLVQAGIDLYKVQLLLGHVTPTMTQRYAHHHPESLRDGVRVLDDVKKKNSTNLAHLAKSQQKRASQRRLNP
jgi:integrase